MHDFQPYQVSEQPRLFASLRITYKNPLLHDHCKCHLLKSATLEYRIVLSLVSNHPSLKSILEKRFQKCSLISIIPKANTAQCRSFHSSATEYTFHFQEKLHIPSAPGLIAFYTRIYSPLGFIIQFSILPLKYRNKHHYYCCYCCKKTHSKKNSIKTQNNKHKECQY